MDVHERDVPRRELGTEYIQSTFLPTASHQQQAQSSIRYSKAPGPLRGVGVAPPPVPPCLGITYIHTIPTIYATKHLGTFNQLHKVLIFSKQEVRRISYM